MKLKTRDEMWQKVLEVESQPDLRIQFWFDPLYDLYQNSKGEFSEETLVIMLTSQMYEEDLKKLEERTETQSP